MTRPTLLVLAAGMGSRYGGLKQLDAVGPNGETLIDYAIYDACRAGFDRVVFVIRRDFANAFHDTIGRRYADRIPVAYVYQYLEALPLGRTPPDGRTKPWGTGHAVLMARQVIEEPFAVINADDFYGAAGFQTMADCLRACKPESTDYAMVGYRLRNTLSEYGSVSRGLCCCDASGELQSVIETHGIHHIGDRIVAKDPQADNATVSLSGDEVVSMNLWGFTPSIFPFLAEQFDEFLDARDHEPAGEFYLPAAVGRLTESGQARVRVEVCEARWLGVTYREDKPRVARGVAELVNQGVYPTPLWPDGIDTGGVS